jgi:hypothetical protein
MTPEEREEMNRLCELIQTEKDPNKFDNLVRELNNLLEAKHERIHPGHHWLAPYPSDPLRPDLRDYPENMPLAERESLAGEAQLAAQQKKRLSSNLK